MMWYAVTGKPRPSGVLIQETIAAIFAVGLVGPFVWWLGDRTPPWTRLYGEVVPAVVERGKSVHVKYWTTKRLPKDCPGTVQQEIVDSQNTIFSKLAKPVGPARWEPDPENSKQEILTGNLVSVPEQAAPGRALFRTVTFQYCNWLQRWWHWPIVQVGPDLYFTIELAPNELAPGPIGPLRQ